MKTIKIMFPQIVFEVREIEVTDEKAENLIENCADIEKAEFVWDQMTELEQQWTYGLDFVTGAYESDLCKITIKT